MTGFSSSNKREEGSTPKTHRKVSLFLGSLSGAMTESLLLHPLDTVAKRLQKNQEGLHFFSYGLTKVKSVVFQGAVGSGTVGKVASLYTGLGAAMAYRTTQRVCMFAGQPLIRSYVEEHYGKHIENAVPYKYQAICFEGLSGSLSSLSEVIFLPLDAIKTRRQTELAKNKDYFQIVKEDNVKLFRGTFVTAFRNLPAAFALFGGIAWVKEYGFKLQNYNNATLSQELMAASIGAGAAVVVSNPADVVKTRIQASGGNITGRAVIKQIVAREGITAFVKGIGPRLLMGAPKLVIPYVVTKQLTKKIDRSLDSLGMFSGTKKVQNYSKKVEVQPEQQMIKK